MRRGVLGVAAIVISGSIAGLAAPTAAQRADPGPVASPSAARTLSGIRISGIEVAEVSTNEAVIDWFVHPPGTGQVEYGESPGYGSSSKLEVSFLPRHSQRLRELRPGTTYHFRVTSTTESGAIGVSADGSFRTSEHPIQPPAPTGVYGSGIAADTKNNLRLNGSRISHRFRASTSSELVGIRLQQRGGEGYSEGSGGSVVVSIRPDDGSEAGLPSDETLATLTARTGNPEDDWSTYEAWVFSEPARLEAGELYHVVIENADPDPTEHYISINEIYVYDPMRPRQAAFDDDYAVLYDKEGAGWRLQAHDTADMALVYADGTQDGQAYIDTMCDRYGVISGPDQMVRERFTVSGGDREVDAVSIRLKRTSGDEPLVVEVEREDGPVLAVAEIPASELERADPGCTEGGAAWVTAEFPEPVVLEEGATHDLRLSTGRSSQYTAEPLREGTDKGMRSYRFTDGGAERSTDGGSSWTPLYRFSPVDLQFYFRPTT